MSHHRQYPRYKARAGDQIAFEFDSFNGGEEKQHMTLRLLKLTPAVGRGNSCWPVALTGKRAGDTLRLGNGYGKEVNARIISVMRPRHRAAQFL